ncbi:hypothetical protein [Flavivirga jejuensis]|uniref:Uncharacterized protein n=1 Tax=Flavivirga jejuensis TaxID=870487 RepID=A0ABT8WRV8_9FLAO|nr:hypothetical protein [Flavivirga jejuensis]MDO5975886.1 hypothetical protein [Flavivirga jejuensis]
MKKLFFIALFVIGLTTTIQAQCLNPSNTPGYTGSTGFLDIFTFGSDSIDVGISVSSETFTIDAQIINLTNMGTYYGPYYLEGGETFYFAEITYGGYTYYADISKSHLSGLIDHWEVCRY